MENERKKEHLENFLKSNFKSNTLFENVYIEHFALTETFFSSYHKCNDRGCGNFIRCQ